MTRRGPHECRLALANVHPFGVSNDVVWVFTPLRYTHEPVENNSGMVVSTKLLPAGKRPVCFVGFQPIACQNLHSLPSSASLLLFPVIVGLFSFASSFHFISCLQPKFQCFWLFVLLVRICLSVWDQLLF